MSWTRRPQAASTDPDPHNDDPLADKLRLHRPRRATDGTTEPIVPLPESGVHEQRTIVDNNLAGRARARRERQMRSPFQTQQLAQWVGDPQNSRRLLILGGGILAVLLLLVALSVYSRINTPLEVEGQTPTETLPGAGGAAPAEGLQSAPPAEGFQSAPPLPELSAPPVAAGAFVVSGTGNLGLFLRPEPSTNNTPLATLPEGTRVEWTGESHHDGMREWRKVRSELGEGWVAAEFLQPAP
ncbi:SH3 domain-containing protein [Kallotenue papyrolyticum]|uniref:SH3 domain-containing protein n=1 Tax=Kallotenue papyrolyticum TaxID=1325125 RepID=UPI0004926E31|nr:SH3 domain-containing protein [Kallotenue papyrolyticum]